MSRLTSILQSARLLVLCAMCGSAALAQEDAAGLPFEPAQDLQMCPDPNALQREEEFFDERTFVESRLREMETTRDWISERFRGMAESIDHYFTEQEYEGIENESHLKLEFLNTYNEHGDYEPDIKLNGKLDIPNTERRLKLFFSSEDVQEDTLEQRLRATSTGRRIRREDSVSGLEFSPDDEERKWKRSFGAGVKLRSSLVPFVRARLRREWDMGDYWTGRFRQSFWYFDDKGLGSTTEQEFSRPLGEKFLFRSFSEAEYRERKERADYAQVFSVLHPLSNRSTLEYRAGLFATSEPHHRIDNSFYGLAYKFRLYEDWLFVTLRPEVYHPRENDWHAEALFTVSLEIFFSEG